MWPDLGKPTFLAHWSVWSISPRFEISQQEGLIVALSKCVNFKKLLKFLIGKSQKVYLCLKGRFSKIWSQIPHYIIACTTLFSLPHQGIISWVNILKIVQQSIKPVNYSNRTIPFYINRNEIPHQFQLVNNCCALKWHKSGQKQYNYSSHKKNS